MEALYGYMTESELENSIMEKEFDIEMKRLFLEFEYITEAKEASKKQNVFQKMVESIQKFIQKILDSMSDFMDKMKEKKVESKLKDAPPVKMDYDPRKKLNEIEKNIKSTLNKLKHPGLIKKDESGTHLTDRGKKVAVGAGITIGAAVLFDVYRRINRMMKELSKELKNLNKEVYSNKREISIIKQDIDFDNTKQSYKNESIERNMRDLKDNISSLYKTDKDIRKEIESSISIVNSRIDKEINPKISENYFSIRDVKEELHLHLIYDAMDKIKEKYPQLNDSQKQKVEKEIRSLIDHGVLNKSSLISFANSYIKSQMLNE